VLPIVKAFRHKGWEGLGEDEINEMTRILNVIYYNLKK
jgi:hypothetical protein